MSCAWFNYRAKMEDGGAPPARATDAVLNPEEEKRRSELVERVRKCLSRGTHPATPEAEKEASLRLARNLMARHRLSEAECSATVDEGASVKVNIKPGKPRKKAERNRVAETLIGALSNYLHVKWYYTLQQHGAIDFTVYGRREEVNLVAMEFETAFNRVCADAASYEPARSDANAGKKTTDLKNDYALGFADGLRVKLSRMSDRKESAAEGDEEEVTDKQLTLYKEANLRIAELFLQSTGVTLKNSSFRKRNIDRSSYSTGKTEGERYELNAKRRIEDDAMAASSKAPRT